MRLALNLLLVALFGAALGVAATTHNAPQGGWVGSEASIASLPAAKSNLPTWSADYAAAFHGCDAKQSKQPGDLVVVDQDGTATRMEFGTAWKRTHNTTWADDVWVVGWCH